MSRIKKSQFVLLSFFVLTIISVQCKNIGEEKGRDSQNTNVGENSMLSILNNIISLKDSDIFRSGIESSVRSVFSKPMTSAVYALSVLAGVVAMLAFYESPVSPMPVPPLPDPPVGRFPPEHPIWPPPQKETLHMSDKKRIGIMNGYNSANSHMMFPQMNPNQKYSEMDPTSYGGAYQQLLNVIENRNSKNNVKQNRISTNSVAEPSPQVYSSFNVEPDPKLVNDSMRLQSLYPEVPADRLDSVDTINKLYNQNNLSKQLDKIREYTNIKKTSNPEVVRERFNYTATITDPNSNRRPRP